MRLTMNGWCRRTSAMLVAALFSLSAFPQFADAHESWWSENFEVHGFFTSKMYVRSPGLEFYDETEISSWRTELNLEMNFNNLLNMDIGGNELSLSAYAIVRPTYEAVYDINGNLWGDNVDKGEFGTQNAECGRLGFDGLPCPGSGGNLQDEFTIVNNDAGSLILGQKQPQVVYDDAVFFGIQTASILPRSQRIGRVGGYGSAAYFGRWASGSNITRDFGLGQRAADGSGGTEALRNSVSVLAGTDPAVAALGPAGVAYQNRINSFNRVTLQSRDGSVDINGNRHLDSYSLAPLNLYQVRGRNAGDAKSFDKVFDINRRETELKLDCFDAAHKLCWLRELYVDIDYGNWFFRIGKQQLSWGKADAFRLQDKINPMDLGFHNVFPDLEERRIPQLALDAIYSFGDVGPLQDVSLEFAWIFDRFLPDQFGQCGEPYTFTGLCHARADFGTHQGFNNGTAGVDQVHWKLQNTEPWLRLEFRIPKPALSVSVSAGYTFQDLPVARKIEGTDYDGTRPNPAFHLFTQGFGLGGLVESFAAAGGNSLGLASNATGEWNTGFDPYAINPANGAAVGSLAAANNTAMNAWSNLMTQTNETLTAVLGAGLTDRNGNPFPTAAQGGCAGLPSNKQIKQCFGDVHNLSFAGVYSLAWGGAEFDIAYPKIFTVGASVDYQIPRIDTILRIEVANDFGRRVANTSSSDYFSKTDIFQIAIGLDRSTFIPFLNRNRTAFLSFQTFWERMLDYDDGGNPQEGMNGWEDFVISTFFMQNYWRNDTIILTSFFAVDYYGAALITGPSVRYVHNDHLFFDIGVNVLWGRKRKHQIRNLCRGQGDLSCVGDPRTWNPGQYQSFMQDFDHAVTAAYGIGKSSFADRIMRERDEFWMGVTYQF